MQDDHAHQVIENDHAKPEVVHVKEKPQPTSEQLMMARMIEVRKHAAPAPQIADASRFTI